MHLENNSTLKKRFDLGIRYSQTILITYGTFLRNQVKTKEAVNTITVPMGITNSAFNFPHATREFVENYTYKNNVNQIDAKGFSPHI